MGSKINYAHKKYIFEVFGIVLPKLSTKNSDIDPEAVWIDMG